MEWWRSHQAHRRNLQRPLTGHHSFSSLIVTAQLVSVGELCIDHVETLVRCRAKAALIIGDSPELSVQYERLCMQADHPQPVEVK